MSRKKVEDWVIRVLNGIDPSGINAKIHREKVFGPMSDKEFAQYIQDLKDKKRHSVVYAPNYGPVKLSLERNKKVAEVIFKHNFWEKIWIEGTGDTPTHLTPIPAFNILTKGRRQAQLVTKGVSVPKNMRTINVLTGQPTGESQSAKISMPELQLCASAGMLKAMEELMKYRGGDVRGGAALHGMLMRHGRASLSSLRGFASGVESTNFINALFTAAMIQTNLVTS